MRYVLDASVAFKWEVPETDSDKANRLRDAYRQGVHQFLAPDVFSVELDHALTRSERQGRTPVGEAETLWADAMATAPKLARSALLLPRAIAISSEMRVGVYDCLYVALAERRKCRLITADDRLVSNLRDQLPFLVALASLP
jgi:predicted nucleic acid-binding protein